MGYVHVTNFHTKFSQTWHTCVCGECNVCYTQGKMGNVTKLIINESVDYN